MLIWQILLLALLQGFTEFFPVSSSGHLALTQILLNWQGDYILFDLWLHLGTVASILIYYRKDLSLFFQRSFLLFLLLTTGATGIVGLLLKPLAEKAFHKPFAIAIALFATAFLLLLTQYLNPQTTHPLNPLRAMVIGVAQGIAVFPGLSRSGLTICAGFLLGLPKGEALRYAFLASIPSILAASMLESFTQGFSGQTNPLPYLIGALMACLAGYGALKILVPLGKRKSFHFFAIYCIIIAGGILAAG